MGLRAKVAAIEFAGDEVRLAVVRARGALPKVLELHAARAEYTDPEQRIEAFVQAVRTVLKRVRHKPSTCVLCVSSFHSVFRTVTIPFRGKRKVAAAVRFELEPYLAFPIEELVVNYSPVLEIEGQTDVLAAGLRRSVIVEQLAILNAAGLDPEAVDIDAVGLTGLWKACHAKGKGLQAVLHVRDEGSVLAVLYGKTLAYLRHLGFGTDLLHANPMLAVREVQNSLRAFQTGWRGDGAIAELAITGIVLFEDERELLAREIDMPIVEEKILPKLKGGLAAEKRRAAETPPPPVAPETGYTEPGYAEPSSFPPLEPSNRWEAAIGTAFGALGRGFAFDFRKDDLAWTKAASAMTPHVLLASCCALVILVGVTWYYRDARARDMGAIEEVQGRIEAMQKEVADLQQQGIDVDMATFSDPVLLDVLAEIAGKLPDAKAGIRDIRVDAGTGQTPWITVRGKVMDDAAFPAVFAEFAKSALFKVDPEPELKLEEGKSTFKITIRRKEAAS